VTACGSTPRSSSRSANAHASRASACSTSASRTSVVAPVSGRRGRTDAAAHQQAGVRAPDPNPPQCGSAAVGRVADCTRTARERPFSKRDAMKHKGFSAVTLALGVITLAVFIFFVDHMKRLVSTPNTSGAAPPIDIMAPASYDNRPIAAPPSLSPADRRMPLATLMLPPILREGT
jgi:hypothetical protein